MEVVTDRVRPVDVVSTQPGAEVASRRRSSCDGFAVDWQMPPPGDAP